jgi:hypothetical protein
MMVIIVQEEGRQNKERGAQVTGYGGTAGSGVGCGLPDDVDVDVLI